MQKEIPCCAKWIRIDSNHMVQFDVGFNNHWYHWRQNLIPDTTRKYSSQMKSKWFNSYLAKGLPKLEAIVPDSRKTEPPSAGHSCHIWPASQKVLVKSFKRSLARHWATFNDWERHGQVQMHVLSFALAWDARRKGNLPILEGPITEREFEVWILVAWEPGFLDSYSFPL